MKKTTTKAPKKENETRHPVKGLEGVTIIAINGVQAKVEMIGQITKIQWPQKGAANPVGNFHLNIRNKPEDVWLEVQLWNEALSAITGELDIYDFQTRRFTTRPYPDAYHHNDVIKVTGKLTYQNPGRDNKTGEILKNKNGDIVKKVRCAINHLWQIEPVSRYKASIPEPPTETKATAKSGGQIMPLEF